MWSKYGRCNLHGVSAYILNCYRTFCINYIIDVTSRRANGECRIIYINDHENFALPLSFKFSVPINVDHVFAVAKIEGCD